MSAEKVPFQGTLVAAQINFSDPQLLGEALKFGGTCMYRWISLKHITSRMIVMRSNLR